VSIPPDDATLKTLGWVGGAAGGSLRLIDQTRLPTELVHVERRKHRPLRKRLEELRRDGGREVQ